MQHIHNENPLTLFMAFGTLILAGLGHGLKEMQATSNGLFLHYLLAGAQGFMYLASGMVGVITIYRFLKPKKDGHN